ncbi:hypothetical protein [Candidatus Sodalis sp. SoCistrobi]|nr:hypothetical protein [Candidatus Sodalis sp. SoCistrobi]
MIQKGMQLGEHAAAMKIARQLVSNGVDRAIVKISTGLSDHELDNLIQ